MKIQVTNEDIALARNTADSNPITNALQRMMGTLWHLAPPDTVLEQQPPHRVVTLTGTALEQMQQFLANQELQPFEFMTDLDQQDTLIAWQGPKPAEQASTDLLHRR